MPRSPSPPFDWMEPHRSPDRPKMDQARREAMYRIELEERAGLLHRLGHGRDGTRARLLGNLDWDFESGASPFGAAAVDAILDRVYGQTPAGKSAPRGKGGTR